MPQYPTLHIIAQPAWHAPAFIVGTPMALTALRDAINEALAKGKATAVVEANDGEGFGVSVHLREDMSGVPFGYTDDFARSGMPWPEWLRE
jgi:hypothetical protein